jgi:hypothetical protein
VIVLGQCIDDDTNGIHPSLLPSTSELLAVAAGNSGLARASRHPAHRSLHRIEPGAIQRFLALLM